MSPLRVKGRIANTRWIIRMIWKYWTLFSAVTEQSHEVRCISSVYGRRTALRRRRQPLPMPVVMFLAELSRGIDVHGHSGNMR